MSFKALLAAAVSLAATCAPLPAAAREATPGTSADARPADAAPGPALWKLADADTTIYLFGTVHVLPAGVEWLDERITNAFDSSQELVFEIDIDGTAAMQQVMLDKARLEGAATLRELMPPADRSQFETALATFNMPAATFDRTEPWMAAMNLSMLPLAFAGYNIEDGVERQLGARAAGKQRTALETIEQQMDVFDTLPLDVQLAYLDETVDGASETVRLVDVMVATWLEGDAASLATLLNDEMDDPLIRQRLLTDRNARWADWIDERLAQPGTVFVAVGAGHLAGEDSVQQHLAARGHKVDRVWK